ncbi:MAG TPA: hypothetical protein QGF58_07300 [Myxococcota bacterium]|nr:hypothetical protein [Myxococcota bacterium]
MMWLLAGLAMAEDDELYIGDVGITATLPDEWSVPRWSDWDLDAVDDRNTVSVHVGYTMWQVDIDDDSARIWAGLAAERLREEGHDKVEMVSTGVVDVDGTKRAEIELSYRFNGQQQALLLQRSFPVSGRTVHVSAMAVTRNRSRAEDALDTWDEHLEIGKPAEDTSTLNDFGAPAGYETQLPPGWRNPLKTELGETRRLASELLKHEIEPDTCWVAVHPYPDGEAALMLSCGAYPLYIGVIDEHSFEGQDLGIRQHFFGASAETVKSASRVTTGADERLAFLYTLPEIQDRFIEMAVAPYDQGQVLTWAVTRPKGEGDGDLSQVDTAIRGSVDAMRFDGPDGALHPIGLAFWVDYLVSYRKADPIVFGPVLVVLALLAFAGVKLRGRKTSYKDI